MSSLDKGLVLRMNIRSSIDNFLQDLSGNNNKGVFGAGLAKPSWINEDTDSEKALKFDGVDDYLVISNSSSLQMKKKLSIAAKLKFHDTPAGWGLIAERFSGFGFGSGLSERNVRFNIWIPSEISTVFSPIYPIGESHFFVGTYDFNAKSNQQKFYIDGFLYDEKNVIPKELAKIKSDIYVGATKDGDYPTPICLEDFIIWNRVLKPNEIRTLPLDLKKLLI